MTDRKLSIAIGGNRKSKRWHNEVFTWPEFVARLKTESRTTPETHAQYMGYPKSEQDNTKDIGGFVGGELSSPQRLRENVLSRSLLTLDLDNAEPDFLDDFAINYNFACFIYSTHKHTPKKPRLRLIAPFTRNCTRDEYEAVARKVADAIGIEQCDPTTYDLNRLMYWPSVPSDIEPVLREFSGPFIDPDEVLASYTLDWHNINNWPTGPDEKDLVPHTVKKAEDPLTKSGYIGAFCRTYTIQDAIEKFLPDIYTPTDKPDRYTYAPGSTTGGAVVYGDKFIYSNHATDPASLTLCNAYDMVRIHKFGELDKDTPDTAKKKPSVKAMNDLCAKDDAVIIQLGNDRAESAKEDFSDTTDDEDSDAWMKNLTYKTVGKDVVLEGSISNFYEIMKHDPDFANIGGVNDLADIPTVTGPVPWDKNSKERYWRDADDSGLRLSIEKKWGINQRQNCLDALQQLEQERHYHPVKNYIDSLTWDGQSRVDTLLVDFLGAKNSLNTREKTRKTLVAAVKRVYQPGCKFDYMLTLCGAQGIGKSTLIFKLGQDWYSDSLNDISGKNGYDALQGNWILEMSELTATKKADVEAVKQFISKRTDTYRKAFGRNTLPHPRQCIFIGTTNEQFFLNDPTGNRRYWVVDCGYDDPILNVFTDLNQDYVDQVWAEAKHFYDEGESTELSQAALAEEKGVQESHADDDPDFGLVQAYLDIKITDDWYSMPIEKRREFIGVGDFMGSPDTSGTVERDEICTRIIKDELFGGYNDPLKSQQINRKIIRIMRDMPGWVKSEKKRRLDNGAWYYGPQWVYERVKK